MGCRASSTYFISSHHRGPNLQNIKQLYFLKLLVFNQTETNMTRCIVPDINIKEKKTTKKQAFLHLFTCIYDYIYSMQN